MAPFYDNDVIRDVEARISIVDIVGETVKLTRKGNRYWGLCPFHNEKTPSFTVNPDKNMYYCFGCHEGGNIFSFVMKRENMEFGEALEKLAVLAGVQLPARSSTPETRKKHDLLQVNKEAAQFFQNNLYADDGRRALDYLLLRGLSPEICRSFQLGFAFEGWRNLLDHMNKKGYPVDSLKEIGLIKRSEDKDYYFDAFRNRIIFPIKATNGDVLGFGGRVIGEGQPKYLNTQETKIYSKRNQLYGLHQAREEIRKQNQVYIVEGYMDCIKMHQAGLINTVASLGTSLTVSQAALLRRYAETVIIMYDGDEAGQRETMRAIDVVLEEKFQVYVIVLAPDMDPDNLTDFYDKKEFMHFIQNNKINHIQFKLNNLIKKEKILNLAAKMRILAELRKYIQKMESPIELEYNIRILAQRLQLEENIIGKEMKTGLFNEKKGVNGNKTKIIRNNIEYGNYSLEEKILVMMLTDEQVYNKIQSAIGWDFFRNNDYKKIMDEFVSLDDKFNLDWSQLAGIFSGLRLENHLAKLSLLIEAGDRIADEHQIDEFINRVIKKRQDEVWRNTLFRLEKIKDEGDFKDLLNFIINLDIFLTQEGGRK
ncbi:MAG: DNA primase [Syntrophomonadaceae bacterium]|jgi:DNA primase|nr:DNA primase [Syntrophomonadaceae bacterium]